MYAPVYDNGLFTDDISFFPVWDDGTFSAPVFLYTLIDAGYWATTIAIDGVDLSMIATIKTLVQKIPATPATTEALRRTREILAVQSAALQNWSYGVKGAIDVTLLMLAMIPQTMLLAQQARELGADATTSRNLELQIAQLASAYRLLQRDAAGNPFQN